MTRAALYHNSKICWTYNKTKKKSLLYNKSCSIHQSYELDKKQIQSMQSSDMIWTTMSSIWHQRWLWKLMKHSTFQILLVLFFFPFFRGRFEFIQILHTTSITLKILNFLPSVTTQPCGQIYPLNIYVQDLLPATWNLSNYRGSSDMSLYTQVVSYISKRRHCEQITISTSCINSR